MPRLKTKSITVQLPETLHNEFFLMFPGTGERTAFLREVIATTVAYGKHEKLAQRIARHLEEERKRE